MVVLHDKAFSAHGAHFGGSMSTGASERAQSKSSKSVRKGQKELTDKDRDTPLAPTLL